MCTKREFKALAPRAPRLRVKRKLPNEATGLHDTPTIRILAALRLCVRRPAARKLLRTRVTRPLNLFAKRTHRKPGATDETPISTDNEITKRSQGIVSGDLYTAAQKQMGTRGTRPSDFLRNEAMRSARRFEVPSSTFKVPDSA